MRKKGISLLIPVFFLCLLILVLGTLSGHMLSLSQVRFQDSQRQMPLAPFEDTEDGRYYLALPAYLSLEDLSVSCPWYLEAYLRSDEEGAIYSLSDSLPMDQPLTLTLALPWGQTAEYPFQFLQCSTDRTIALTVQEGTMEYLNADKTRKRDVDATILDEHGAVEYQGLSTLSGRGNSTWLLDKKPYNLELAQPEDIGPFQDLKKLCLFAEYADSSKMRNALAYYIGRELDFPYASSYAYADLFINGSYQGLYGITTKEEYTHHLSSDGIQAVFELYSTGKGDPLFTSTGKSIRIHYGERYIMEYYTEIMEQALLSRDWENLFQIIDLASWAKKYAMDELFCNPDLALTSQYYYLDQANTIQCMLPWDYDLALTSWMDSREGSQDKALCAYWHRGNEEGRENWYEILLESPQFRQAVLDALRENFTPERMEAMADHLIRCAEEISGSWYCDRVLWDSGYAVNHPSDVSVSILEGYQRELNTYLNQRLSYLLDVFSRWEDYRLISFRYLYGDESQNAMLQLFLPLGTDLKPYHDQIQNSTQPPKGYIFGGWFTEEGIPLEDIGIVNKDLSLFGICHTP